LKKNNIVFNSNQIYISQNTFIHYNSLETLNANTLSCTSSTFPNKKVVNYSTLKQSETKKINSKATANYRAIPPFNNSPFGLYANGFNKMAISTTNPLFNKKKDLSVSYISITKNVEQPIRLITKEHNQQFIFCVENHFFKFTFSLPPPSFC
jgi:hypothetical protein